MDGLSIWVAGSGARATVFTYPHLHTYAFTINLIFTYRYINLDYWSKYDVNKRNSDNSTVLET